MKVSVIGVGYIGLPTGTILANNGINVIGVDTNAEYIKNLNNRRFLTTEKDLIDLINKAMDNKQLTFSVSPEKSDVFIICVPTPLDNYKEPDLSYVLEAIKSIVGLLEKDNLIIIESTIPPGSTKKYIKPLIETAGFHIGKDIFLAYCPERVLPNNIVFELINNPRVIGGCTKACSKKTKDLYATFVKGEIITDMIENVEMVKLIENAYRDVNLAFANELALLCNSMGLDPFRIIKLANMHPRVNILRPGIGVGGHCIPIDSYFLLKTNLEFSSLINKARNINELMPKYVANKIVKYLKNINNPSVALWGVSYKADSNDIRNSPALKIEKILQENKISVNVFDPVVYNQDLNYGINTLVDADLLLLLVDHKEFKQFDYKKNIKKMKTPAIFDGINLIDKSLFDDLILYKIF